MRRLSSCGRVSAAFLKWPWRRHSSSSAQKPPKNSQLTPMLKHLLSKIKSTGPITVAEYMREVLTNPVMGYYLHKDMLGADGDFVTSPEISQIFGELLGVWCVSEWMAAGKPKAFQLVELGPGRGTLTSDVLRVFSQLRSLLKSEVSVHLVEVSPKLSEVQAQILIGKETQTDGLTTVYRKGVTKAGFPVFWYRDLQDVPSGYAFYLAHEFFDALPIHKFQKTEKGWREVLIDLDPQVPHNLRFVLAPSPTMASKTLLQAGEKREHVEVCPDAGVIIQRLTDRIFEHGGAVLIADYGHTGIKTDTFRGFCGHKLHDVLTAPGTADLTADVDFSYLQRMTEGKVATLGPITQQQFLRNMGIDLRLQVLLRNVTDSITHKHLTGGYDMLMNPKKMGERFKFFSLLPHSRLSTLTKEKSSNKHGPPSPPVAGFSELML
ncbi:protein arginine methyltransferase NDUFAF7, mitochondrial [Latimeria chalumnae]|uniref:protein arginine methyltransferase NDUFAF7, mitochondrial n=1 Tax=Latimeria chalumnae TaxID=7897 RepID=UPI00313CFD7E